MVREFAVRETYDSELSSLLVSTLYTLSSFDFGPLESINISCTIDRVIFNENQFLIFPCSSTETNA